MQDDLELLGRWRSGDQKAGQQLFERYFGGLFRFFSNKVTGDVEDMIQSTFVACLEKGEAIENFRGYLYGTARNVLYEHFRARERGHLFDPQELSLEDVEPSPSRAVVADHERLLLCSALRRLPLDLQILLELHYWEGLTHPELAVFLDVTEGVVKGRIAAAKKQLKALLAGLTERGWAALSMIDLDQWRASLRSPPAPV